MENTTATQEPGTPEPGALCDYSLRHGMQGVEAVVVIPMKEAGSVGCCAACADLYRMLKLRG